MSLSFVDDKEGLDFVIKRLIEMKVKLTDWEYKFISNINHMRTTYTGGYKLTDRQKQTVSNMWEKY